jgi:hypothetical protein
MRTVRLHDTQTGELKELRPRDGRKVGIYACGPTVYGRIHVGNARPFVVFSLLARFLAHEGYEPVLVANITDINDKIYDAARPAGRRSDELAAAMTAAYIADTDRLGLGRPDEDGCRIDATELARWKVLVCHHGLSLDETGIDMKAQPAHVEAGLQVWSAAPEQCHTRAVEHVLDDNTPLAGTQRPFHCGRRKVASLLQPPGKVGCRSRCRFSQLTAGLLRGDQHLARRNRTVQADTRVTVIGLATAAESAVARHLHCGARHESLKPQASSTYVKVTAIRHHADSGRFFLHHDWIGRWRARVHTDRLRGGHLLSASEAGCEREDLAWTCRDTACDDSAVGLHGDRRTSHLGLDFNRSTALREWANDTRRKERHDGSGKSC